MMRWPHVSPQTIRSVLTGAGIALIFVFSALALVVSLINGVEIREEQRALEVLQSQHRAESKARIARTQESIKEFERIIARQLRRHDERTDEALKDLIKRFRALRFEIIEPTPEGRQAIIVQPEPQPTPAKPGKRKGNP